MKAGFSPTRAIMLAALPATIGAYAIAIAALALPAASSLAGLYYAGAAKAGRILKSEAAAYPDKPLASSPTFRAALEKARGATSK